MKNLSLIVFAALIFFGWTAVAGGAIAALAGEPSFVSRKHDHHRAPTPPPAQQVDPAPLRAQGQPSCPPSATLDASVPCEA